MGTIGGGGAIRYHYYYLEHDRSADKSSGNGSNFEINTPSLKKYSTWSFMFTLSQMAALGLAVYSIANSQRFRVFFKNMLKIGIF